MNFQVQIKSREGMWIGCKLIRDFIQLAFILMFSVLIWKKRSWLVWNWINRFLIVLFLNSGCKKLRSRSYPGLFSLMIMAKKYIAVRNTMPTYELRYAAWNLSIFTVICFITVSSWIPQYNNHLIYLLLNLSLFCSFRFVTGK